MLNEKKPSVTLKKKHIPTILEYCIETKQEFNVVPKGEEWLVEINITEINKAIAFGMFLRENKMEANGVVPYVSPAKEVPAAKGKTEKTAELKQTKEVVKDETSVVIGLDSPSFEFEDVFNK